MQSNVSDTFLLWVFLLRPLFGNTVHLQVEKIKTIIEDVLKNFCHILSAVVGIGRPISSVHLIKGMFSESQKKKAIVCTQTVFYERWNINLVFAFI